ncbi:hypothetical protein JYT17_00475 [Nitrospira defluvii]|nr:hypothetical protein [Nitrospira defluvii]
MNNKTAFILMPFLDELSDVYEYLISDGLKSAGYTVKRADDIKSQSNIIGDIVKGILSSDLIVADLTGANPNVYYELGIAHSFNKKVILITQEIDELPFDLRSYRVISYSTHFSKMNQAKEELSKLALEAFNGTLPFGNPVKDFGRFDIQSNEPILTVNIGEQEETDDDLGLLDYRVKLEDGIEELGKMVVEVSNKLIDEVTPEINKAGEDVSSGKLSTKQQRNIVKGLSKHLQEYGAFVKPQNEKFRMVLKDIESGLEYLLNGNIEIKTDEDKNELTEFLTALLVFEKSAFEGRNGIVSLIEVMDSLPKIEKNFNRAKVFMASELKAFAGNIDQMVSVASRAGRLGKSLLGEKHNECTK